MEDDSGMMDPTRRLGSVANAEQTHREVNDNGALIIRAGVLGYIMVALVGILI